MTAILSVTKIVLMWASSEAGVRIIQQMVAWLLNWSLKKFLVDRGSGNSLKTWATLSKHVSEASAVFAAAIEDGDVTTEEANECRAALSKVLEAWSEAKPTPEDFEKATK